MNLNSRKNPSRQISLRLPKPLLNRIEECAADHKISTVEAARFCIASHFNQVDIDQKLTEIKTEILKISLKMDDFIVETAE